MVVANISQTPRARSKSKLVLDKINGLFSGKREKKQTPAPPVPPMDNRLDAERSVAVTAKGSPVLKAYRTSGIPSLPALTPPPSNHPAFRNDSRTSNSSAETPVDSVTGSDDPTGLKRWTGSLIRKAHRESDVVRRERLLTFAKVRSTSSLVERK